MRPARLPGPLAALTALALLSGLACPQGGASTGGVKGESGFPDYVLSAKPEVQHTYRYALEHPEVLQNVPCYCGCMAQKGHRHSRDCFISSVSPGGAVTYEPMGAS